MTEPYLICHLVRGEPAFDVANKLQIGEGEGWIIPTSGHRAYPYWTHPIHVEEETGNIYINQGMIAAVQFTLPEPPPGHPDHYEATAAPKGKGIVSNLASILNLIPKPTIRRR